MQDKGLQSYGPSKLEDNPFSQQLNLGPPKTGPDGRFFSNLNFDKP